MGDEDPVQSTAVRVTSAPAGLVTERKSALALEAIRAHARLAPGMTALWAITLVGAVTLPVASAALLGGVVGAIARGPSAVVGPVVALAMVELVHTACATYGWVLCRAMGRRYRLAHRQRIMRALLDPPGIAHVHEPAVLDAALAADNGFVVGMIGGVNNVIVARLTGISALLIVGRYQPAAAVILAAAWIVMGRWRWRRVRTTSAVITGHAQALRRAEAMSDLALQPTAAKEVRLFGLRPFLGARYASEWLGAMNEVWRERRTAARGATAVAAMLLGAHVVALTLIARDASEGTIAIGALAAVLQSVFMARELGEGVMGQWEVDFGLPLVALVRRLEQAVAEAAEPMPGRAVPTRPTEAIRFEHVSFRYPGGYRDVLSGLDLEVSVGSSLAIVGENGAGKTTAVQLLARLRDPTSGRITVDGVNIAGLDPTAWHDMLAAVSQDALRLPLTVTDNIGAGRTSDRQLLASAAGDAGILDTIERLPLGWDTVLAKGFPGGADLSGGEWQRLALARGLVALATGAEILVLDEPTAHLDVRAEAMLYDQLLKLTRGHTTILVSHRFSTVRRADRIAVLADGRVAELGSHDQLLAAGGRYAELFHLQAAAFSQ